MTQRTRIQKIKLFIKVSFVFVVFGVFVVLVFFVKPTPSFENSNIKKWVLLSDTQKTNTLNRIIDNNDNIDLTIKCIDKIAQIPGAYEMQIRDAASLCYNGIKLNATTNE